MEKSKNILSNIISSKNTKPSFGLVITLLIAYIAVYFFYQHENFPGSVALYLGILFTPFIFRQEKETKSIRFLFPVIVLLLMLCFFKSATLYYFAIGFGILFLLESYWGKLNNLPVLLLIVVAPFFRYLTYVWSFPIRLSLSDWTAKAISFIGFQAEAKGNLIFLNNEAFEVEPACVGLKMIGTALVCCLMIMSYFEQKEKRKFSLATGFGLLILGFSLTILANFSRLIALVIFSIFPTNPLHDIIGIFSLIFYVLIPFSLGLHFYFSKKKKSSTIKKAEPIVPSKISFTEKLTRRPSFLSIPLLVLFILSGWQFKMPESLTESSSAAIELSGFKRSIKKFGVLAFESEDALIYIKPPVRALQGAHDPRICWQGSGFEFKAVQKEIIHGTEIFTAMMTKEDDLLYTAWWYDNGIQKTIIEMDWRLATLKHGKGFHLVNVSSYDKAHLMQNVENLLKKPILNQI